MILLDTNLKILNKSAAVNKNNLKKLKLKSFAFNNLHWSKKKHAFTPIFFQSTL